MRQNSYRPVQRRVLLVGLALTAILLFVPAGATAEPLFVGPDDDADHASLQTAIDAADHGDRIEVKPGTYDPVTIEESIVLAASDGAVIDASDADWDEGGITIRSGEPLVDGFTVVGPEAHMTHRDDGPTGIYAEGTAGGWVVRNVTTRKVTYGVWAAETTGDWTVENATLEEGRTGVFAGGSRGDWTVADTHARNNSLQGINARGDSDWAIRRTVIADSPMRPGVDATRTAGDWTVENVSVRNAQGGIIAEGTTGEWTIRNAEIRTVPEHDVPAPERTEAGISVAGASGRWAIRDVDVAEISGADFDASNASSGVVDGVWWGDDRERGNCLGSVDCRTERDAPPEIDVGSAGGPTRSFDESATSSEPNGGASTDVEPEPSDDGNTTEAGSDRPEAVENQAGLSIAIALSAIVGAAVVSKRYAGDP